MKDLSYRERFFLVLSFVALIGGFYQLASPEKDSTSYNIPVNSEVWKLQVGNELPDLSKFNDKNPITLEQFLAIVKSLPEGAFKSNLLFIVAADYNGDSIKLNEILQAYGKLLQAQLKSKNTL